MAGDGAWAYGESRRDLDRGWHGRLCGRNCSASDIPVAQHGFQLDSTNNDGSHEYQYEVGWLLPRLYVAGNRNRHFYALEQRAAP